MSPKQKAMKTLMKTASGFVLLITLASFAAAQQPTPAPARQTGAVVANNVQLVIEGKVINVHDGDTITVLENTKKFHIRLQGIDAPELKQAFGSVSQQNLSRMVLGKQVSIFWTKVDKYRRTVGTIKLDGQDMNIEQDRLKAKRWEPPPPEGTIVGNRNSKKYQRPDCSGYRDTSEKNRVFFKSVEEAQAAGYKRAGNCPAQIQTSTTKPSPTTQAAKPATRSTAPVRSAATEDESPSIPSVATIRADPMLSSGTPAPGSADANIIGNKNSKIYHFPGCSSYGKVSEKNQVKFDTAADAERAGYKLAGNCSAATAATQ
jgi:endonuclease YncB( thermonuclease family)/methylphosphotriester-DNA--protein-cysteine methyltransferase